MAESEISHAGRTALSGHQHGHEFVGVHFHLWEMQIPQRENLDKFLQVLIVSSGQGFGVCTKALPTPVCT